MDRNKQITVAAILTLAIAGCTVGESPTPSDTATPTPGATPTQPSSSATPAQPVAAAPANAPGSNNPSLTPANFNNPIVPGKGTAPQITPNTTTTVPSLIQPTNVEERKRMVITGRRDPFGQIVTPIISQPLNPIASTSTRKVVPPPRLPVIKKPTRNLAVARVPIAKNSTNPTIKQPPKNPVKPKITQPTIKQVTPKLQPSVIPGTTLVGVLPPVQQPEAAQAVTVTGVMLIGREPKAIIKVPDEPSRYVQAGQRLSSGVLVKRIEMNQGINPVVILEQNGIEVVRAVGDKPASKTANTNNPQPSTSNSV